MLRSQRFCFLRLLPVAVLALLSLAPQPAAAQQRVTPQTSIAQLATNVACTGTPQQFAVPDFGQTEHYATITFSASPVTATSEFVAVTGGNGAIISNVIGAAPLGTLQTISAVGYYPLLFVQVQCASGNVSISYSGTSATPLPTDGLLLASMIDVLVIQAAPANANLFATSFVPPFGTEGGYLSVTYAAAAGPAGSTIQLVCTLNDLSAPETDTFSIAAVTGAQVFPVPTFPCPNMAVHYVSGGASAQTVTIHYLFTPPGFTNSTAALGTNITTATTTAVKGVPGTLRAINVNTSAAGTIKIFDIVGAGCAGAPASGLKGTITLAGTEVPSSIPFNNLGMTQGICIVTSGTPDITVTYQ